MNAKQKTDNYEFPASRWWWGVVRRLSEHFVLAHLIICSVVFLSVPLYATETLVLYEFTGNTNSPTAKHDSIVASHFGISPSVVITYGSTGTWPGSGTPYVERTGTGSWNDTEQTGARHWLFSLEGSGGGAFSVSRVSFNFTRTTAGPDEFALEINGTTVATWSKTDTTIDTFSEDISNSEFENVESATIRIYGWVSDATGNGAFRIDDVKVEGSLKPSNPSDFTATVHDHQRIDLSWALNADDDDVMVAWNSSDDFGVPEDGETYSVDDELSGGGTILYSGNAIGFEHTGLDANVVYHYRAWSLTAEGDYSGGTGAATTTDNLPAPVAADATAIAVNQFTANWAAVGGATGYELDVSLHETFSVPGAALLSEGFEGDYPPAGWTHNSTDQSSTYAHEGTYSARLTAADDYLITPLIDEPHSLRFWSYTTKADPGVIVEYASDIAGPWTEFAESPFSGDTEQWNERVIDLTDLTDIYVKFRKSGSGNLYIDALKVAGADDPSLLSEYAAREIAGGETTSAAVTGLVSATTYYYRLRATNATSTSGNSGLVEVQTLPMPAPEAQAAENITSGTFDAGWSVVAAATGYRLDVARNNEFTDFVPGYENCDVGNVTTHTVTGLYASVTYYYRVRAYDGGSASVSSGTQSVTTTLKPEPANHATGLNASTVTHRTIVLNWADAVEGILPDGYLVRGSVNGFDGIPVPVDGVNVANSTTWSGGQYANKINQGIGADILTQLQPEQTYCFKLFPYANQFSTIDYKTDGDVPQIMITTTAAPFEDMEDASKTAYAAGDVELKSGWWHFDDALLGITASDKRRDQRSARIRNLGSISMLFDVENIGRISVEHADYGADAGGRFVIECSEDGGVSWFQLGSEIECGTILQTVSVRLLQPLSGRLRIRKTAAVGEESRINIDNIRLDPPGERGTVFFLR